MNRTSARPRHPGASNDSLDTFYKEIDYTYNTDYN